MNTQHFHLSSNDLTKDYLEENPIVSNPLGTQPIDRVYEYSIIPPHRLVSLFLVLVENILPW